MGSVLSVCVDDDDDDDDLQIGSTYCFYLHFSDNCLHLCRHVSHNVSAVVRSGLLQVVGMSNLVLYFAQRGRLFLFHVLCLMDVSYQLSPVNFPSECSHTLLGISLDLTDAFIYCAMCPCDKHGDKDEDNSPKKYKYNTSSQKYRQILSVLFS